MFLPEAIFFEKEIEKYKLGEELIKLYKNYNVPFYEIENHNNIEEMRKKENKDFPKMKRNLILGIRKTHNYVENHKVSDFLVPYTSSGCIAMCLYCYLVCNYNKCSYLRIFVNREYMLEKLINKAQKAERELTFEIGSNSDLVLENTITHNLEWTIENFANTSKGKITFPTKFSMIDSLLKLNHKGKVIIRMSVNPEEIIKEIEKGTSPLKQRIEAINKLKEAGYEVGILIAPVILVDNYKILYKNLINYMYENLSKKAKKDIFFEIIFMTYSYVHRKINEEAFPKSNDLYSKELMAMRGKGKYRYKNEVKQEAEKYIVELLSQKFKDNKIIYIV